jgi:hypothetical protein
MACPKAVHSYPHNRPSRALDAFAYGIVEPGPARILSNAIPAGRNEITSWRPHVWRYER